MTAPAIHFWLTLLPVVLALIGLLAIAALLLVRRHAVRVADEMAAEMEDAQ